MQQQAARKGKGKKRELGKKKGKKKKCRKSWMTEILLSQLCCANTYYPILSHPLQFISSNENMIHDVMP